MISKYYWDKDLEKQFYKLVEYDPVNEKVLGERDIDEGYTQRRILDLGKYRIDLCFNSTMDGVSYYALDITTGSGDSRKVKRVEIKEEGRSVYDISLMLPLDKKTVLFPANADKEAVFVVFVFIVMVAAAPKAVIPHKKLSTSSERNHLHILKSEMYQVIRSSCGILLFRMENMVLFQTKNRMRWSS